MTQFYSRNDVNYNGDVYSIPFSYTKEEEIQVYLDDELFTDWFFLQDTQIKLRSIPEGVTSKTVVSVRRVTDISKKAVTYTNNTLLNKENLNLSQDQLLHAVQEIYDNNAQFEIDIKTEVDEKVERVSAAIEQLELLEDSVETAVEAANTTVTNAEIVEEARQQVVEIADDLEENAKSLPMFTPVWSDHIYNDASYLRADTFSWHSADIYKTGYKILEKEYNDINSVTESRDGVTYKLSPNGFKIADVSQVENILFLYKYNKKAWFYVIDTEERRFKLPREKTEAYKYLYFFIGNYDRPDTEVDISKVTESINTKIDLDGSNYVGSGLEKIIQENSGKGNGSVIFDTKLTDHILTFEESKGWALQGTYVYKEAVAGSRYGYPDFYNKCVEEKDLGTPTETVLGENTITLYTNANGHTFYDIADKEAIDAWYSTYGIAWYYGIDKENERIFLPRTKHFAFTGGVMGNGNALGLTAGTGTTEWNGDLGNSVVNLQAIGRDWSQDQSIYTKASINGNTFGITTDPTKSGITLETDDSKYLYICVGNTNVESAVTDVVDVTTTENDTMPLFTGMYFDFTPNNVSWLRAGQQANSGGIYAFTYNELVNILNGETKYGDLKVINVADMEVGVDYSEYWKVNQEDMYFITPTAISNKALSGGVMGNGMTLGLTDGERYMGLVTGGSTLDGYEGGYGSKVGDNGLNTGHTGRTGYGMGIVTDPTKSGIIAEQSTSQLYFKVANAVQNLELLDAGEVLEAVQQIGAKPHIVDTYVNGTSWYRIYSDGWCEQGGSISRATQAVSVTFLKPFNNQNINIQTTRQADNVKENGQEPVGVGSITETGFTAYQYNSASNAQYILWIACGYIA